MNIFGCRLSKTAFLLLVAALIILNIYLFVLQNQITSEQAKEENSKSHVNKEVKQDKVLDRKEILEINKNLDQIKYAETGVKSTVKNRTVWNQPPPGTQMGKEQVAAIRRVIKANSNVLVWGLGNDSPFWHDTTEGKVIFIEPAGFWFNKIIDTYPYLKAYTVNYTTETEKSFNRYIDNTELWAELDISSQLPPVIRNTYWDVIIVDAPPGYKGAPGRYQSIYTSSLLAGNGTHVFVDDYERKVEREFSKKMLGEPIEVVKRPAKGYLGNNQQAHFLFIKR